VASVDVHARCVIPSLIIGIQGGPYSFNEAACKRYVKQKKITHCSVRYLVSSRAVLSALTRKKIDLGIVCLENEGFVEETLSALSQYVACIKDVVTMKLQLALLCLPKIDTKSIHTIASHPQAVKQSSYYLNQHYPTVTYRAEKDTAGAAKKLKEKKLSMYTAVIAPRACASVYGLKVIANNIQNAKPSKARFLVLERL